MPTYRYYFRDLMTEAGHELAQRGLDLDLNIRFRVETGVYERLTRSGTWESLAMADRLPQTIRDDARARRAARTAAEVPFPLQGVMEIGAQTDVVGRHVAAAVNECDNVIIYEGSGVHYALFHRAPGNDWATFRARVEQGFRLRGATAYMRGDIPAEVANLAATLGCEVRPTWPAQERWDFATRAPLAVGAHAGQGHPTDPAGAEGTGAGIDLESGEAGQPGTPHDVLEGGPHPDQPAPEHGGPVERLRPR